MPRPKPAYVDVHLRLRLPEARVLDAAASKLGMNRTELLRLLARQSMFLTVSLPSIIPNSRPD